jgi:WD40 repeat protein/serine/threonine protein kinase
MTTSLSKLSLSLFGSFSAKIDERPLTSFGSIKAQALLIYLAVESEQVHQRETLMTLLWPDLPQKSAQQNLRQTLRRLRQTLAQNADESPIILSERFTLALNTAVPLILDVHQFESATHPDSPFQQRQAGIDLYRGDFLADFYLEDSIEFEEWATNKRSIYRQQALDTLTQLTQEALESKQLSIAQMYAQRQLTLDSLREVAYQQLMETLARAGQREAALAQYELCRQRLADELGMEPDRDTEALRKRIEVDDVRTWVESPPIDPPVKNGRIRGYDLQEEIGAGTFGVVYRAVQPSIQRNVAVKIIRPHYANHPDFIRRFEAEAQTIARLEHPHIVPLYDYWREADGAYLVMRYVEGGSLQAHLQEGVLDVHTTVSIINQIAAALHTAHQQGFVHRDVKPANILLDDQGNAYLTDFGIVKALQPDQQHTHPGAIIGSPAYLSPEQALSKPITPLTDQYNLGLVLYEMLTGERPFTDSSPVTLILKHVNDPLPLVTNIRPDLTAAIDATIQQATAKTATERYPDILSFAAALRIAAEVSNTHQPTIETDAAADFVNPYKGLHSFQESDGAAFFGRDALIQQLLAHLTHAQFLAVVGPSGSGKSSVVKAGLIPALREGTIAGSEAWYIVEMMPGTHPLEELEAALLRIAVNPPASLLTQLQEDNRGLTRAVKRILPANGQLLLLIDQFEELFTLTDTENFNFSTGKHLLDSLVAAVRDTHSQIRVVITLRADFYDRPLLDHNFSQLMRDHTELVMPLDTAELSQAIRQPAAQAGVLFETGLVTQIVADVRDQPGALPLLQYALTELFAHRQGRQLTQAAYEAIGGTTGAISQRADDIYRQMDDAEKASSKQLFLRMVTLGEGTEDTRRRVPLAEIESLPFEQAQLADLLAEYGRYRLLAFDRDPITRSPTVEVAHEALLREWTRLRKWLVEGRDDIRQQRRLSILANEWQEADRADGYLLREARLDQFVNWAEATELSLIDVEQAYIKAGLGARQARQAEEDARQRREFEIIQNLAESERQRADEQTQSAARLRKRAYYLVAVLVVLMVVALTAVTLANNNATLADENLAKADALATQEAITQENLQISEQLRLAAEANSVLGGNNTGDLAALLALRSLQDGYSTQADEALLAALQRGVGQQSYTGHSNLVKNIQFSADGRFLLSGGAWEAAVRLWDVNSGVEIWRYQFPDYSDPSLYALTHAAFSVDEQTVWIGTRQSLLQLNRESGIVIQTFLVDHDISNMAISPDENWFVATGYAGVVTVVDMISGEVMGRQRTSSGQIPAVAIFKKEDEIIFGGEDGVIRLWNLSEGTPIQRFEGHEATVVGLDTSPDGRQFLSISLDGTAKLWDIESSTALYSIEIGAYLETIGITNAPPLGIQFSPDGETFVHTTSDTIVQLRQTKTGQLLRSWEGVGFENVVFSADGAQIAASTGNQIYTWFTQSTSEPLILNGHTGDITDVSVSPNNQMILSGSVDKSARLWQIENGLSVQEFRYLNSLIVDVEYAEDGDHIWLLDWNSRITKWDVATHRRVEEFKGIPAINAVNPPVYRLSPYGNYFIFPVLHNWGVVMETASNQAQQAFDQPTQSLGAYLPQSAISADGTLLVTGFAEKAQLWDVSSGEQIGELTDLTIPLTHERFVISPDNQYVLSGSLDGIARLWDVDSLAEVQRFTMPDGGVTAVAYAEDGSLIATGGDDNKVRLWDVTTGEQIRVLVGHTETISALDFAPDGSFIVSGSLDNTIRVWQVDINYAINLACQQLLRDFTPAERAQYGIPDEEPTCR